MVARGRFELPSMGLFLVRESKAHHWPGHLRPLLVHYTTGLQETRVFGQVPISLLRDRARSRFRWVLAMVARACRGTEAIPLSWKGENNHCNEDKDPA